MGLSKFFEHKAVLLILGFGLTTVAGGCLSSHWKRLEWENQQNYLVAQRNLDRRADLIDQLTRAVAETNAAAEDVLALHAYPNWKREQIRERKDNWRITSRNWRITSKVLDQKLPIYFSNQEIAATFDKLVKKRMELGNIIVNLPEPNARTDSESDRKRAQDMINEIKELLRKCGTLMAKEVKQSSSRPPTGSGG